MIGTPSISFSEQAERNKASSFSFPANCEGQRPIPIGSASPAHPVQGAGNLLMYINYSLLIWAAVRRQPGLVFLRILSLAIGLGCGIIVLLHVQYVRSFDAYFPNVDNIYRVTAAFNATPEHRRKLSVIPDPWAPQLLLDYPQIQHLARIRDAFGSFAVGSQQPLESKFHWAEPDIIQIFALEFVSGTSSTALSEPFSIVLSESNAELLFPGGSALGKTIALNKKTDLKVTGVYRDLPETTHIELPLLVSAGTGEALHGENFLSKPWWLHFGGARCYLTPELSPHNSGQFGDPTIGGTVIGS